MNYWEALYIQQLQQQQLLIEEQKSNDVNWPTHQTVTMEATTAQSTPDTHTAAAPTR